MINLTQATYSKGKNDEMLYHKLIPAVAFDYADGDALIEAENKVKFVDPTTNKEFTNPLKYTDVKQFDAEGKPVVSGTDVNTLFGAMTDYFQQAYNLSGEDALRRVLRMCSVGENAEIKKASKPEKSEEERIAEVAKDLCKKFPKRFPTLESALAKAKLLVE